MKTLATTVCVMLILLNARSAGTQEPLLELSGAVSYTTVHRFDYNKDGHRNPVRFWIEFKARPAVGVEGQPGYRPESGSIHYYVFDEEKQQRVEKWLEGFGMLNHDAVAANHPATNIVVSGHAAAVARAGALGSRVCPGETCVLHGPPVLGRTRRRHNQCDSGFLPMNREAG